MTNEERFRRTVARLGLTKIQLEAICELHAAIYEGVDWKKWMCDKVANVGKKNPLGKAVKVGGTIAALGLIPAGYYAANAIGNKLCGDEKLAEQTVDNPDDEKLPVIPDVAVDDSLFRRVYDCYGNPERKPDSTDARCASASGANDRSLVRDEFNVSFPDASADSPSEGVVRTFMLQNLDGAYKAKHTKEEHIAHINRILRAVKKTADITSKYGIGEAELLAVICVESKFNDKPRTTTYRGLAQLGKSAIDDARKHAREFGLSAASMRDPENVEDAVTLAAGYLLFLMYDTGRSNKVNERERDDKILGDMRFVFACYNGGIGTSLNQFDNNKEVSVPMLYRMVLRGELTANEAVSVRGSMKEALSYPSKILRVLDYLDGIGVKTNFTSGKYIYRKR